jgi:hypothetical protein
LGVNEIESYKIIKSLTKAKILFKTLTQGRSVSQNLIKTDFELHNLVREKKWDEALNLFFEIKTEFIKRFLEIQELSKISLEWTKTNENNQEYYKKLIEDILNSEFKEEFIEELEKSKTDEPSEFNKIVDKIKNGSLEFLMEIFDKVNQPYCTILTKQLDVLIYLATSAFMIGLVVKKGKYLANVESNEINDENLEIISEDLSNYKSFLIENQQNLYNYLKENERENIECGWFEFLYNIELKCNLVFNKFLLLHSALNYYLNSNEIDRAIKVAKVKLSACFLLRQSVYFYAFAYFFCLLSCLKPDSKEYLDEVEKAKQMTFNSSIPHGDYVSISQLLEPPQIYENKMVELEGFAKNIELSTFTINNEERFASIFELTDIPNGKNIKVRLYMRKIVSEILVENSYVKINGFFSNQCSWNYNEPGIELDRINFTELKNHNWQDYMVYKIRKWFDLYPGSINMIWTVEC